MLRIAGQAAPLALALSLAGAWACTPARRTDIPTLTARRAAGPITIDGRLDETAWARAGRTEDFVDTRSGAASEPRASARITWDEAALYVAFDVRDPSLRCHHDAHDDRLWEEDVVELMIDPDGDGRSYVELQVSPTNLVFDTWFDARRQPQPFGHVGWSSHLRSAVTLRGEVNDERADGGWIAEVAMPWSAFASIGTPASRPSPGETWRIAMYVLDARPEGQFGVGWSAPLVGDFHVPERFGRVRFE